MKLINVQIKLFRNILDTENVPIQEDVTCLVGKNESGKTSFLHALNLLNPVRPNVSLDVQRQYPAWLEKKHRHQGVELEKEIPVEVEFQIEPDDQKILDEQFGPGAFTSETITRHREYSGHSVTAFSTNEKKAVDWITKGVKLPKPYSDNKKNLKTFEDLQQMIEQMQKGDESAESVIKKGAEELVSRSTEMLNGKNFRTAVHEILLNRMPKFFYFSEYSTLPYSVNIRELLESEEEQLDDDQLTALSLLRLAASDDDYLLNPDYETRKRELENVGNALTQDVLQYWSQNPELRVDMDITKETEKNEHNQPIAVLDELKIRIRDERHWLTLPFDEHSTGFQWFFSFLAAFSQFEYSNEPLVILLDEPALGLHARAQKDFLRFIDERLAPARQVIYSTHSPFMIQSERLERARIVEDKGRDEGAKITQDVLSSDPDTLFPLQGALGYDLIQNLLITPHNIIVEGTSDYTYLLVMSDYLKEQGRVHLNSQWSIIPVGGADLIPTFVALIGYHLDVTVLIDSKKSGHQRLTKLANDGYLKHKRIIAIGSLYHRSDADIEDVFAVEDYLVLYNEAYGKNIQEEDLNGNDRIIKRVSRYENIDDYDHGKPADVLLRQRDKLLPKFSSATYDNFEKLIEKINSTFPTKEAL